MLPGSTAIITVNVVRSGIASDVTTYLNAWIDFNADGDWNDSGEQVSINQPVVAGANDLNIDLPASAVSGSTYARFRLSTQSDLSPGGMAADGEVEDYTVEVLPLVNYELQVNYANSATQLYRDRAGQYFVAPGLEVTAEVYVRDLRAIDAAGVQQAFADLVYTNDLIDWTAGSLSFGPLYSTGQSGTIDETAIPQVDEAGGITPNETGDGRHLLFRVTGTIKDTAAAESTVTLALEAADESPAHDTRLFNVSQPVTASYGSAALVVKPLAWQNARHRLDINANGTITAVDALAIINRLNGAGPGNLDRTPNAPNIPQPFYDANGDGRVTAIDALDVINHLNTLGPGPVDSFPPVAPPPPQTPLNAPSDDAPAMWAAARSAATSIDDLDITNGAPLFSSVSVTPVAMTVSTGDFAARSVTESRSLDKPPSENNAELVRGRTIEQLFSDYTDDSTIRMHRIARAANEIAEVLFGIDTPVSIYRRRR